jgi:SAM-dependent methyltransferase
MIGESPESPESRESRDSRHSRRPLDYLPANMAEWEGRKDHQQALARRNWLADEPGWGLFHIPESVVDLLPSDLEGLYVVELGCGTAYVSAWLAQRGARPVGLDPTAGQLAIARQLQTELARPFPLIRAAAEEVPLRESCVDLAISEYGAAIWADPYRWIPEAARVLRPGGELVFLGNSTLMMLCAPDEDGVAADERLVRPQFGMHRFEWPDDPTVEFHLSPGDWIRLLRANRFVIEDLIELRPPEGSTTDYEFVTEAWARKWPCEEAWRARLEE